MSWKPLGRRHIFCLLTCSTGISESVAVLVEVFSGCIKSTDPSDEPGRRTTTVSNSSRPGSPRALLATSFHPDYIFPPPQQRLSFLSLCPGYRCKPLRCPWLFLGLPRISSKITCTLPRPIRRADWFSSLVLPRFLSANICVFPRKGPYLPRDCWLGNPGFIKACNPIHQATRLPEARSCRPVAIGNSTLPGSYCPCCHQWAVACVRNNSLV